MTAPQPAALADLAWPRRRHGMSRIVTPKLDRRTMAGQLGRNEGNTALVRRRTALGLSQTVLAYRAGMPVTSVYLYETLQGEPTLSRARALARVLETTVDDLFPADEQQPATGEETNR